MTVIRDLPREYALAIRELTPAQREWIKEMHANGFRPYRAGTKLKLGSATIHRWRTEPRMRRVLDLIDDMVCFDMETSMRRLISELSAIANFDIRRLYDADGKMLHPKDWDDDTAAAIQGLDIEERHSKAPDGTKLTETISISKPRAYNKLQAIEQLNQMRHAARPMRVEVTGKDGKDLIPPGSQPSDIEIAKRVLFMLSKGTHAAESAQP